MQGAHCLYACLKIWGKMRGGGGGEEKPLSGITSSMANGDVPNPAHAHNTCLPLAAVPTEAAMELGFLTAAPC